jgi:hypothetical protein
VPFGTLVTFHVKVSPHKKLVLFAVSEQLVAVKFAVTDLSAVMLTTQDPVPVHAPDQPVNALPLAAVGVSVTCVPLE